MASKIKGYTEKAIPHIHQFPPLLLQSMSTKLAALAATLSVANAAGPWASKMDILKAKHMLSTVPIIPNQFYAEILSKYLSRNKKNIMMDIGGGYGKLGYYMMKNNQNLTFIDFDIPETLVLASFYLSKCFPNKKNLFYGEKDLDEKVLNEYDLI